MSILLSYGRVGVSDVVYTKLKADFSVFGGIRSVKFLAEFRSVKFLAEFRSVKFSVSGFQ
jgi:hypothetical protein